MAFSSFSSFSSTSLIFFCFLLGLSAQLTQVPSWQSFPAQFSIQLIYWNPYSLKFPKNRFNFEFPQIINCNALCSVLASPAVLARALGAQFGWMQGLPASRLRQVEMPRTLGIRLASQPENTSTPKEKMFRVTRPARSVPPGKRSTSVHIFTRFVHSSS